MQFVFPVLFSVMIAMLFVSFYARWPSPLLPFSTGESDLPKPSHLPTSRYTSPYSAATPAPAPDVTPEPKLDAVAATPAPAPDVTPEPALDAVAATPAPAPDVTAEPALDAVAATPAPAPDVTPEPALDAVAATPAPAPDVTPEPKLDAVAATPAPAPDVTPEPALDAVAATPAPAPDVTAEPALDAVAATPAPAPDLTPEPKLDAVAATPAPAPDLTPEPKLDAAPKAQSAPDVLRKVEPAADPARAEAPPKKKRVTATGPTGAAGATTGTELARPRDRDFGQAAGELPPDQSALKAEVTGESAMNQPMQPIPPASDTLPATNAAPPATNAAPISVPQSATPAPNRPAVQLDSDEMTRLIKRGKDFLAQGNFASARLLFKRAADAGSAEAALALGSTYDPSVIKQLGAVSITPDIDGALKWYETAADHGSAEAAGLFANLMRLRKAAMAAKPTAAKPRSETEPVEEKANSRTVTEPEIPPSTEPLATPGPVPKKEPTTIGGKAESQATGQPSETPDPVPKKEPTTIGGGTEGSASDQLSETSDPVLKKAKITVAAKMEDPTYAEFVDMKRVMRKNSFGEFEIICGHVKGKMKSGEATGDKPFLYLVKEDEAFVVGGNPDSMAAIVYRAQCISANSR